jgi:hypothetical protein
MSPAITYSIIAPLVMGFATVGFALIYFATRYNSFYVLSNNIDTKGAAYARAIQQLMTGVYLAEVCLIGLFAINTSPGPIVLMAVFLGITAVYHAIMRHALRPLTRYIPDSLDGDAVLSTADHRSYDLSKAGVPPSEAVPVTSSNKIVNTKEALLSRFFSPQKYKSFQTVQALVPSYGPPEYLEEEEQLAYYNPSLTSEPPALWIVRDEMGISRQECKDSGEVISITDEYARFDEKNKIVWDMELLDSDLDKVPVYEKHIEY